jgi:hypothetical protein
LNTFIEFQIIEVGSAYRVNIRFSKAQETPLIPKVGEVISLSPVKLTGKARVVSIEDKIVPLDNVPSGNKERREILVQLERNRVFSGPLLQPPRQATGQHFHLRHIADEAKP